MSNFTIDSERIITGKSDPNSITCTVDTLRAATLDPIDEELILNLQRRSKKLFRQPGWKYSLFEPGKSIWFNRYKDGKVSFELNMSDHDNAWDAFEVLREEFGDWALDAKIVRLDVNLTIPLPIREVYNGLDFGRKRSCERWGSKSTGESFYIGMKGRKHEMIIYDKRKESRAEKNKGKPKIKHPCTRIEINSIPKKGMLVKELPLLRRHRPFSHVTRYKILLKRPVMREGEGERSYLRRLGRFMEFKSKYEDWGIHLTRRRLSIESHRNYHVWYRHFYSLRKLEPSLDDIFQIGIDGFFRQ